MKSIQSKLFKLLFPFCNYYELIELTIFCFRFSNSTQQNDNVICRQLPPNDNYNYDLTNACEGHYLIQNCPPLYISVQSAPQETQNNYQCSETGCRFPDEIKFGITLENLGCYSSTSKLLCQLSVMVFSIFIHIFLQKFRLV